MNPLSLPPLPAISFVFLALDNAVIPRKLQYRRSQHGIRDLDEREEQLSHHRQGNTWWSRARTQLFRTAPNSPAGCSI